MKILVTCFLLLSFSAFATPVARVIEVSGNAFVFTEGFAAKTLKYGDKIQDISEIMVEDESLLSLVTDRGHIIYLTGGSLIKFANSVTELKNGQVWVKAEGNLSQGMFFTGNSIVNYNEGEFIYSFDNNSGKSQLLVLTGETKFSNKVEPSLKIDVSSGHFSFVEQKFEKSLPRTPTKVGLESFKTFRNLFVGFKTMESTELDQMWGVAPKQERAIASVNDQFARNKTRGRIIKVKTVGQARVPASNGPAEYYKNLKTQKVKKVITTKNAPVAYYGFSKTSPEVRVPASVEKVVVPKYKNGFEKSLEKSLDSNPRHSSEVNSLIDELKSYKQDYKKQY